jgi:uncharacterized protein YaiI (UPF0178 family)
MSNKQAANGMKIIVDGDAIAASIIVAVAELARQYEIECLIAANETKKPLDSFENVWISVPVGPDSADAAILNILREGDIVITNDLPLGWRSCGKGATPLRSDGGSFDSAEDPMRFWRRQRLRALRDGERECVKAINTRLLMLRLANAIAPSASGASANEEKVLLAALTEINEIRISDSDIRAEKSLCRHYYMPEFGKKPNRRRKPEFAQKSRFMHPKRYVPDRECEALRAMREIADEYETRFRISRRALLIETQRRKTALRSEPRDGHRKRRLHQKRTSDGIERCGRKTE